MRSLADGKLKFTLLTTKPADPAKPTETELNAGIDASPYVLTSDFTWSNAESETFDEKPLSQKGRSQTLGMSTYELGATFFREWNPDGSGASTEEDAAFQAVKTKGTTLWAYARETAKDATEDWAADDECYLGGEVQTDSPARVGNEGAIKRRVPFVAQHMYEDVVIGTGTTA